MPTFGIAITDFSLEADHASSFIASIDLASKSLHKLLKVQAENQLTDDFTESPTAEVSIDVLYSYLEANPAGKKIAFVQSGTKLFVWLLKADFPFASDVRVDAWFLRNPDIGDAEADFADAPLALRNIIRLLALKNMYVGKGKVVPPSLSSDLAKERTRLGV